MELDPAPLDVHLIAAAQERANLAQKIVKCEAAESKSVANNNWFAKAAKDAGIDLEDELVMEDIAGKGDKKKRQTYLEAQRAKKDLERLLAMPMQKQRHKKFMTEKEAQKGAAHCSIKEYKEEKRNLNKHGKPKRRRKGR